MVNRLRHLCLRHLKVTLDWNENQQKTQETEGGNKGEFQSNVKDDIKTKVLKAIDKRQMDSFAHVLETWAVVVQSQRETQETEDDGEEAKVQANANNNVGAWTTNTYGLSTLILETWALIDVRPKRRTVTTKKQGSKLICREKKPSKAQQKKTRAKWAKKI